MDQSTNAFAGASSGSTEALVKFPVTDIQGLRDYYRDNGYVIVRKLLEASLIDAFLAQYEKIKTSRTFVYFSQSIHRVIRPSLNEHGFIRESMENATRLGLFPQFSGSIKRCIYHEAVCDALTALDGHERHVSWQDMFFDLSTGTIEHQDTWYLDTDPPGSLVAGWFALEDIDERAGPFFVMPGSHRLPPLDRSRFPDHEHFRKATLKFVAEHGFRPKAMPVEKGDVILWHPFTVHGAFSNRDPGFSRKSFTSHYFPYGAKRAHTSSLYIEPTLNRRMFRVGHGPDLLLANRFTDADHGPDFLVNLCWYGRFLIDAARGGRALTDMRRASYSDYSD